MATSERMADGAPVAGGGVLDTLRALVKDAEIVQSCEMDGFAVITRANDAITAVAELIAADKEYDEARAEWIATAAADGGGSCAAVACYQRVRTAEIRRAAALSNISASHESIEGAST